MSKCCGWGLILAVLLLSGMTAAAQPAHLPMQVFLLRGYDASTGRDQLVLVDMLTGREHAWLVTGDRYSVAGDEVLYIDRATNRVMRVLREDEPREHPFIQPSATARRIDWVYSPDYAYAAWTVTEGDPNALITTTYTAAADGSNLRVLLIDGPRAGVRVLPVAFSADGSKLYLDYQPDTIGDLTPFRQYAGLFALDVATGAVSALPAEPSCFCGADIQTPFFLRLTLADGRTGFGARVYNLLSGMGQDLPPLDLPAYTHGGDVLIAPDGTRAVYTLAQIRGFGTPNQSVQVSFVLVDMLTLTQTPLVEPIPSLLRPVEWTDGGESILFINPLRNGTWKLNLQDNRLVVVAEATYLGTLT